MREKYIRLMEKVLNAYTDEQIQNYFQRVKKEGRLTEHGFPRLTADIGILIAHGRRKDLLPIFVEMMTLCCESFPRFKAENDFSVKEIIFCLMEVEEKALVSVEQIAEWKGLLRSIEPEQCYSRFARTPQDKVYNWASFTMVSEFMRQHIGLCDARDFVDLQIPTQLHWLDENGMYKDAPDKPPMVYDLVPRSLFVLLLHFGYRGRYYEEVDECLKKAGILTLEMQSVTGEIPYGGRSNQFLFNEALLAIVLEYEARRYAACGEHTLAARCKAAVEKAVASMEDWLDQPLVSHVKNQFPIESKYGCENYAYFEKYMITTASFAYAAYLVCDDSIPVGEEVADLPMALQTSDDFHKIFLKNDAYFLELDWAADLHYEAKGVGRIHRKGAPSAICLSHPCTASPNFNIDREDAIHLSLCPGIWCNGQWMFATDEKVRYRVEELMQKEHSAAVAVRCIFGPEDGMFKSRDKQVLVRYTVDATGVEIKVQGEGKVAHMLPAFSFDGACTSMITVSSDQLEVAYRGWVCRYVTSGKLFELEGIGCNRNGHYQAFYGVAEDELCLKVEIVEK